MNKYFVFLMFVLLSAVSVNAQQQERPGQQPAPETGEKFKIGMAGYTFAKFDIDKTLETLQRADVHYLCIKDFHLPLTSTIEEIAVFKAKLKEKGVTGYAVGPIYMKTEAEIDNAFEYAKKVGVTLIVGVPNYELLPYVDKKVKEYGFRYAIHHMLDPDLSHENCTDSVRYALNFLHRSKIVTGFKETCKRIVTALKSSESTCKFFRPFVVGWMRFIQICLHVERFVSPLSIGLRHYSTAGYVHSIEAMTFAGVYDTVTIYSRTRDFMKNLFSLLDAQNVIKTKN